ncbi:hypothetical protein B0F88_102116 [Methylobacter tundripaludum]|uniref:Uncharacterized protein n=1 Tax=Methylobacter tundripaludum TaxID=173365 RepID=A0A2S6H6N9_9GAMM|nr:hypothetical protein B0F88_102116 [Methylobacter tundripaludum]
MFFLSSAPFVVSASNKGQKNFKRLLTLYLVSNAVRHMRGGDMLGC